MHRTGRREFLGAALIGLTTAAYSEGLRLPPGLAEAEWKAIQWGEPKNGLEAGLRLILPKVARRGEKVELGCYLRNRSDAPITFTYDPALWERTATVIDADGKRGFVFGTSLSGLPTVVRVTLAPHETVVMDHPGFWMGKAAGPENRLPYLEDPKPGIFRVIQDMAVNTRVADRKALQNRGEDSTTPLVVFSEARKPRRLRAEVLAAIREDLNATLKTGEIEVRFVV